MYKKKIQKETSVAQIIGSVIRKPIYFVYQYQIGTMTEKAADTDVCMLMCTKGLRFVNTFMKEYVMPPAALMNDSVHF